MARIKPVPARATVVALTGLLIASIALVGCTKNLANLNRPEEPVTVDGSTVGTLIGVNPNRIVGFAWDGTNWTQVPVQVDERDLVNPGQILHRPMGKWAKLPDGSAFSLLVYTPPATTSAGYTSWDTYTPHDSNPLFDANDQISFLADDVGLSTTGIPDGVVAASRTEIKVTDPLVADEFGYVYLFRSTTLTGGSNGTTGVNYTFSLDSGSYLATYKMGKAALAPNAIGGFNPEHSTVVTPAYSQSYGDRWLNNGLTLATGDTPQNVLERSRFQFGPGLCSRHEDTFDGGDLSPFEGAFIVNISGPVRAIRSYMGANSGQYTVGTDIFYPQREDSTVELRVHAIPGVMAFDDLDASATGLTYRDDQNAGVAIDGNPDVLSGTGPAAWQMVSGDAGSLVTVRSVTSDIGDLAASTYQLDDRTPDPLPCTGDGVAWGQNGVSLTGAPGAPLTCTDPTIYGLSADKCPAVTGQSGANHLTGTRQRYVAAPNLSTADAAVLQSHSANPLVVTVT